MRTAACRVSACRVSAWRVTIWAAFAASALLAAAPGQGAPVSQAASFYHQGRFDSALTRLEAIKDAGDLKRRDSLALFQYLGMASARLGREPEAAGYFASLLGLDSLFQFPRNEDSAILAAFGRARAQLSAQAEPPPPAIAAAPQSGSQPPLQGEERPVVLAGISLTEIGANSASDGKAEPGAGGHRARANPPRIGLGLGAMPFGTGWFVRNKVKHGLVLGVLQAGGLALSLYASDRQSREAGDPFRIEDSGELDAVKQWQLIQRASLSTAVGAYLFSLIASAGD